MAETMANRVAKAAIALLLLAGSLAGEELPERVAQHKQCLTADAELPPIDFFLHVHERCRLLWRLLAHKGGASTKGLSTAQITGMFDVLQTKNPTLLTPEDKQINGTKLRAVEDLFRAGSPALKSAMQVEKVSWLVAPAGGEVWLYRDDIRFLKMAVHFSAKASSARRIAEQLPNTRKSLMVVRKYDALLDGCHYRIECQLDLFLSSASGDVAVLKEWHSGSVGFREVQITPDGVLALFAAAKSHTMDVDSIVAILGGAGSRTGQRPVGFLVEIANMEPTILGDCIYPPLGQLTAFLEMVAETELFATSEVRTEINWGRRSIRTLSGTKVKFFFSPELDIDCTVPFSTQNLLDRKP